MTFPNIHDFPKTNICPYERQMGEVICRLLKVFEGRVPDVESHAKVTELAATQDRWSAAHAVFDELRGRGGYASVEEAEAHGDDGTGNQHHFEESCCKAMYNASNPDDPFDPSSPFFVAQSAFELALVVGIPFTEVIEALTADTE